MSRNLPPSASVAEPTEGAWLHAPAASRNAKALSALLRTHAPPSGSALEIASGTGQHIVAFADALPDLRWQPTDIEAARLASIDAHVSGARLSNVAPAEYLDASVAGWSATHPSRDLIVLVNLLHLIPTPDARIVLREVAQALAPGGTFVLYGPFMRDGMLTSEGDRRFDAELQAADPAIGYKNDLDIATWLGDAGLMQVQILQMPANNLALIARKPRP